MSLQKITVSKSELLDIVKENKQKHDEIYDAAEKGYWLDAEEYLKKYLKDQLAHLQKNHRRQVKDLKKQISKELKAVEQKKKEGYSYMRKPFPENHADDYEGTIKRLELSVDHNIELDTYEFDSYVRNKWQWRNSFLSTNSSYAVTGSYSLGPASYSLSASFSSGSINRCISDF